MAKDLHTTPVSDDRSSVRDIVYELDNILTPLEGHVFALDSIIQKVDMATKGKSRPVAGATQIAADITDGLQKLTAWQERLSTAFENEGIGTSAEPAEKAPEPVSGDPESGGPNCTAAGWR